MYKYIEENTQMHFGNITMFPSDKNAFKSKKKDLINIREQCLDIIK